MVTREFIISSQNDFQNNFVNFNIVSQYTKFGDIKTKTEKIIKSCIVPYTTLKYTNIALITCGCFTPLTLNPNIVSNLKLLEYPVRFG